MPDALATSACACGSLVTTTKDIRYTSVCVISCQLALQPAKSAKTPVNSKCGQRRRTGAVRDVRDSWQSCLRNAASAHGARTNDTRPRHTTARRRIAPSRPGKRAAICCSSRLRRSEVLQRWPPPPEAAGTRARPASWRCNGDLIDQALHTPLLGTPQQARLTKKRVSCKPAERGNQPVRRASWATTARS